MSLDFLSLGGGVISYLIPFLFVLTLVVFIHELGHFLVARWCGVRVRSFLASAIVTVPGGWFPLFRSADM
jgi:Peptidase family M50